MKEVWRDIKGYEKLYKVSNLGRVKSLQHEVITVRVRNGKKESFKWLSPERLISPVDKTKKGFYCVVPLTKKGKSENLLLHRLVAEAFLPNPGKLPCVNHKDSNKHNNHVSNLEWCTRAYNNRYKVDHGEHTQAKKVYCLELDRVFNSMAQADKHLGLPLGTTCACIHNPKRKCGYNFSLFKEE